MVQKTSDLIGWQVLNTEWSKKWKYTEAVLFDRVVYFISRFENFFIENESSCQNIVVSDNRSLSASPVFTTVNSFTLIAQYWLIPGTDWRCNMQNYYFTKSRQKITYQTTFRLFIELAMFTNVCLISGDKKAKGSFLIFYFRESFCWG